MTISSSPIHPPRGVSRSFWRLPIWLYRLHLGWLLTGHFIMLDHVGRKSGQVRQTVIEVVKHDKINDVYYVASGFGVTADWYQNLLKTPQARLHSGFRNETVVAEVLPTDMAEEVIQDYARRYPMAIRILAKIIGYEIKKGEENYREFAKAVPIVTLKVQEKNKPRGD
jgi:deazaflavin-dependent oxidoreductase (nitroreductase family)